MPVRIEDVQMAKSQRSYRVRLGADWYGAYLKYKPDQQPILSAIGRMVEVETTTLEKGGPWITAWTYAVDQSLPAGARPITPHQGAAQVAQPARADIAGKTTQPTNNPEPARQLSAEELKVVNGIVMAALQHGKIEELEQVQVWMKGVAATVREL